MNKPTNKLFIDIEGKTFGRLLVTGYAGPKRPDHPKQKMHQWHCKCECGAETTVLGASLQNGNTRSCGCFHKEATSEARWIELKGKKFGNLLVIDYDFHRGKQAYWLCECICGKRKSVAGGSIRSGRSTSCGCRRNFKHGMYGKSGYKAFYLSDPVKKIQHAVSGSVRKAIKSVKGVKNSKTFEKLPYTPQRLKEYIESLWEPWMNWENYGGKANDKKKTWHIDHIVPHISFPYKSLDDPLFQECWDLSNLRPLEKIANFKKGSKI